MIANPFHSGQNFAEVRTFRLFQWSSRYPGGMSANWRGSSFRETAAINLNNIIGVLLGYYWACNSLVSGSVVYQDRHCSESQKFQNSADRAVGTSYILHWFPPIFLIANRIDWVSTLKSIEPIFRKSLPIRPIRSQCTSGSSVQRWLFVASDGSSTFS